jgi:hypothetical protein
MSDDVVHEIAAIERDVHRLANGLEGLTGMLDKGLDAVIAVIAGSLEPGLPDSPEEDVAVLPMIARSVATIAVQFLRFNNLLESGRLNIRTHHPLCSTPREDDYSIQQLDAMSLYLNEAIRDGRLVLPPKGGA